MSKSREMIKQELNLSDQEYNFLEKISIYEIITEVW